MSMSSGLVEGLAGAVDHVMYMTTNPLLLLLLLTLSFSCCRGNTWLVGLSAVYVASVAKQLTTPASPILSTS